MRTFLILMMLWLVTGCGVVDKVLGLKTKDPGEPEHQPTVPYNVEGNITGDHMVYGDQKFKTAKTLSVSVCDSDDTNCVSLPRKAKSDESLAHYTWVRDGVWIRHVPSKLHKSRFHIYTEQWN